MWRKTLFGLFICLLGVVAIWGVKSIRYTREESPAVVVKSDASLQKEEKISVSVYPEMVIQGEPVMMVVSTSSVKSMKVSGKEVPVFKIGETARALVGIDLRGRIGTYPIAVELSDGSVVKENLIVGERKIAKAPLGIPEKLGGNTQESQKNFISTPAQEGKIISAI